MQQVGRGRNMLKQRLSHSGRDKETNTKTYTTTDTRKDTQMDTDTNTDTDIKMNTDTGTNTNTADASRNYFSMLDGDFIWWGQGGSEEAARGVSDDNFFFLPVGTPTREES